MSATGAGMKGIALLGIAPASAWSMLDGHAGIGLVGLCLAGGLFWLGGQAEDEVAAVSSQTRPTPEPAALEPSEARKDEADAWLAYMDANPCLLGYPDWILDSDEAAAWYAAVLEFMGRDENSEIAVSPEKLQAMRAAVDEIWDGLTIDADPPPSEFLGRARAQLVAKGVLPT